MAVIIIEAAVENETRGDNKKSILFLHDEIFFLLLLSCLKKLQ